MKTHLISFGNAKALFLPNLFWEQCHLEEVVEIHFQDCHLEIYSSSPPRLGWEEQFAQMAQRGDDKLLDSPTATVWDNTEWEW
jgi:antitoxin component of MazEF toxin-antitoxin module